MAVHFADATAMAEPGMVSPSRTLYIKGSAVHYEDQILITETVKEVMAPWLVT